MAFFRMNIKQFYCLSQLVAEEIRKPNTNYKKAITPDEQLKYSNWCSSYLLDIQNIPLSYLFFFTSQCNTECDA